MEIKNRDQLNTIKAFCLRRPRAQIIIMILYSLNDCIHTITLTILYYIIHYTYHIICTVYSLAYIKLDQTSHNVVKRSRYGSFIIIIIIIHLYVNFPLS